MSQIAEQTYTLIIGPDCEVLGPFITLSEARHQAERFAEWWIFDDQERLLDWSPVKPESVG